MNYEGKLALAERAARESGRMLLSHRRTPAQLKAENDYVTEMDVKSEQLIRSILLGACPEDGFFGEEEGGSEDTRGRWIVDPIDGTSNFFRGEALWTISIAYESEGELVVGVVYCPRTGEMWSAVKGKGATLNGEPIHVSDVSEPRKCFVHMSFAHRIPEGNAYVLERLPAISRAFSDLRRSGSAAYDLCCVADGRADGFFEKYLHIYDIAAGVVILREAEGRLSGWTETENPLETGSVLATNGRIHEFLRDLLK